jgi:uncharacterized membrane protein
MTQIEAVTVVPASAASVWQALLDHERWPEWRSEASTICLGSVDPVDEVLHRVGDRRRCTATMDGLPIVGRRKFTWEEQITDIAVERTLEFEAQSESPMLRKWRVRLWLANQHDGHTRVRGVISYRPATFGVWLVDQLLLRRRIESSLTAWLGAVAASFGANQSAEVAGQSNVVTEESAPEEPAPLAA